MGFDTAYHAIAEDSGDQRWAFGTGFTGPLAGVDEDLPDGADPGDLGAYCLMLGDDALVMSHRLQQWLARAPELEEETALANIALDLLRQAPLLLGRRARRHRRARVRLRVRQHRRRVPQRVALRGHRRRLRRADRPAA